VAEQLLTSIWTGLSPKLIASFWQVDRGGNRLPDGNTVQAPLINDPTIDIQQNWQSPFENVGQSSLPTLQQMLQSGALQPLSKIIDKNTGSSFSSAAAAVEGRSSVTKLNSIQIWSGSPPLKMTLTALFRAWKDPVSEVINPADELVKWCLPKLLQGDVTILSKALSGDIDSTTAFPSETPVLVAMNYKNRSYAPLVIESLSFPLGGPVDIQGNFTELAIAMTLCSITSIDRGDWVKYSQN